MKVGDLVKVSFAGHEESTGMVIEEYHKHFAHLRDEFSEVRVKWFGSKDTTWIRRKDVELISESR